MQAVRAPSVVGRAPVILAAALPASAGAAMLALRVTASMAPAAITLPFAARAGWAIAGALALLLIAGCGSAPKGGASGRDGPAADIPPDLARVPDAEPRVEPLRSGGPNKPYEVLGQGYRPETRDVPIREKGLASWYGRKFHGRKTASGEVYNMHAMTAAHKTMPLPSYARVRNPANGREVVVRINDRGPFVAGRIIDLSYTAALKLDLLRGIGRVEVERITFDEIRTGAWRRGPPGPAQSGTEARPATVPAVPEPPGAGLAAVGVAATGAAATGTAADNEAPLAVTPVEGPPPRHLPEAVMPAPGAEAAPVVAMAAPPPDRSTPSARAYTAGARGYWVQLGAFRERGGAEDFQQRVAGELDWLAPLMAVFNEAPLWRLQAGPYPSRDEAAGAAQRVREALQLVPVIVEKR